jgi:hypothetical protein
MSSLAHHCRRRRRCRPVRRRATAGTDKLPGAVRRTPERDLPDCRDHQCSDSQGALDARPRHVRIPRLSASAHRQSDQREHGKDVHDRRRRGSPHPLCSAWGSTPRSRLPEGRARQLRKQDPLLDVPSLRVHSRVSPGRVRFVEAVPRRPANSATVGTSEPRTLGSPTVQLGVRLASVAGHLPNTSPRDTYKKPQLKVHYVSTQRLSVLGDGSLTDTG